MHYTSPRLRDDPAMVSASCNHSAAENIISIQRQMLAQKHKELMKQKGAMVVSPSTKNCSTLSRNPLKDIPEQSVNTKVAIYHNHKKVVPYDPNKHHRELVIVNSRPRIYSDEDSQVEVVHGHQPETDQQQVVSPECKSVVPFQHKSNNNSSGSSTTTTTAADDDHSLSTATLSTAMQQTTTPPLHIPGVFKPALGCITAPEFLIRCFVARLRKGVTVIKHGRSRFQRSSRPYILLLDDDGQVLTWKPANSKEPSSSSSPESPSYKSCRASHHNNLSNNLKRIDMIECTEVRLAQTPDPNNPNFTGTSILREKCDVADSHKSFALIFPQRTVDITARSADQCKLLIEGFSALCYQMQLRKMEQERQARRDQFQSGAERKSCLRVL